MTYHYPFGEEFHQEAPVENGQPPRAHTSAHITAPCIVADVHTDRSQSLDTDARQISPACTTRTCPAVAAVVEVFEKQLQAAKISPACTTRTCPAVAAVVEVFEKQLQAANISPACTERTCPAVAVVVEAFEKQLQAAKAKRVKQETELTSLKAALSKERERVIELRKGENKSDPPVIGIIMGVLMLFFVFIGFYNFVMFFLGS
jgi:preprotein translocase subunit Sec61beta